MFIIAFRPRIVIAHTPTGKANLQAGATQPCHTAIHNYHIRAEKQQKNTRYIRRKKVAIMRRFLIQINYHHWRTGHLLESKICIIQACNKKEAEVKVWNKYGADNACMPYGSIDITDEETADISIFANEFKPEK